MFTFCRTTNLCEECGRTFSSKFSLQRHVRHHRGESKYRCIKCDAIFSALNNLQGHMTSAHGEPKRFICEKCGKQFVYKHNLDYHTQKAVCFKRSRNVGEQHTCELCSKTFPSKRYLHQHMTLHGEPKLSCNVCGLKFRWRSCLKKHAYKHATFQIS